MRITPSGPISVPSEDDGRQRQQAVLQADEPLCLLNRSPFPAGRSGNRDNDDAALWLFGGENTTWRRVPVAVAAEGSAAVIGERTVGGECASRSRRLAGCRQNGSIIAPDWQARKQRVRSVAADITGTSHAAAGGSHNWIKDAPTSGLRRSRLVFLSNRDSSGCTATGKPGRVAGWLPCGA